MPHYGFNLVNYNREEEELNLALALSKSEHDDYTRKQQNVEFYSKQKRSTVHVEKKIIDRESPFLAPPSPHFQLSAAPPRYSSLYRREEPPIPFSYKSPRTAAGHARKISPVQTEIPVGKSCSNPGKIMIIGHGLNPCIVASSSYTFEVESPPKVSYQTQRSLVREVQVPVRSVSRSKENIWSHAWCVSILFLLIISLAILIFFMVHHLIVPLWERHDHHDDNGGPGPGGQGFGGAVWPGFGGPGRPGFGGGSRYTTTTFRPTTYGNFFFA